MVNNGLHLLSQKPPTLCNPRPYVACRQCRAEGRASKTTRNICAICPGNPGLCSTQCFINYHQALGLVPAFVQTEPVQATIHQPVEVPELQQALVQTEPVPSVQATIHQPVEVPDLQAQLISVPTLKKKL